MAIKKPPENRRLEKLATQRTLSWNQIEDWLKSMNILKDSLRQAPYRPELNHLIPLQ